MGARAKRPRSRWLEIRKKTGSETAIATIDPRDWVRIESSKLKTAPARTNPRRSGFACREPARYTAAQKGSSRNAASPAPLPMVPVSRYSSTPITRLVKVKRFSKRGPRNNRVRAAAIAGPIAEAARTKRRDAPDATSISANQKASRYSRVFPAPSHAAPRFGDHRIEANVQSV